MKSQCELKTRNSDFKGWFCASIVLASIVLSLSGPAASQEVTVLDLNEPADYRPSGRGMPGSSGGGIGGMKIGPDPYPIPLEITITKVEPKSIRAHEEFFLEIELKNTGPAPFFFPVSRDFEEVLREGNRGRRTGLLSIYFGDVVPLPDSRGVGTIAGSPSIPQSLKRLNPGDSILVRTTGSLRSYNADKRWLIPDDSRQGVMRVRYTEQTLKDDQFVIEVLSEEVNSTNSFTLAVEPAQ